MGGAYHEITIAMEIEIAMTLLTSQMIAHQELPVAGTNSGFFGTRRVTRGDWGIFNRGLGDLDRAGPPPPPKKILVTPLFGTLLFFLFFLFFY